MLIERQMIVARDACGQLLLHSAIALAEPQRSQLEQLGTLKWLVVPNGHHRLDAPAYKARYPALEVVAPSGAVARVAQVVPVDLSYEQFPASDRLCMHVPPWSNPREGVVEVRDIDGITLVFNDLVYVPPSRGVAAWPYRLLRQGPQVPWLAKRLFMPDAARLRAWLLQLAEIEHLVRVVPGHGDPVATAVPELLRRLAADLD
jgi:hypothetical protein